MPYRFSVVERDLLMPQDANGNYPASVIKLHRDAFVSIVKALEKLGYARTGELTSAVLRYLFTLR